MRSSRTWLPYLPLMVFAISLDAHAQQSYFNVPSSEITKTNQGFVQEQVDVGNQIQSNLTLDYGLGSGWEIGANWLDADVAAFKGTTTADLAGLALMNLQKSFALTNSLSIAIGTQQGTRGPNTEHLYPWAHFSFGTFVYAPTDSSLVRLTAGIYEASASYLTGSDHGVRGVLVGSEIGLWKERLSAQVEWISGAHSLGTSAVGFVMYFSPSWMLSAAAQSNNPEPLKPVSAILEFTYSGH